MRGRGFVAWSCLVLVLDTPGSTTIPWCYGHLSANKRGELEIYLRPLSGTVSARWPIRVWGCLALLGDVRSGFKIVRTTGDRMERRLGLSGEVCGMK
jgi:hypothetical protein